MKHCVIWLVSSLVVSGCVCVQSVEAKAAKRGVRAPGVAVTGTYKCGNKDLGSDLVVQEQAGKRIKFSLFSYWRTTDGTLCNGSAEGTVALKGNSATYKEMNPAYTYTLTFRFSGSGCTVDCDQPSHFGGFNVDPTGTYKRVNGRAVF